MRPAGSSNANREETMKSAILLAVLLALIGCGVDIEPTDKQSMIPAKEEQEKKLSRVPTFTYRPGAGLIIEGR
jgi:hypothetical protein